ncbi:MAG: hypothetical protein HOG03_09775 [Desulfobacula sp.]|uniref:hypothetical protein n=1 Tax=Desulfobacula sp. TaxID=2593537 RepID=UPI001D632E2E|nr:hypothetical protein [Desulfobacula sp.]MBT3485696.1 hypothetical protein [Desulfobacula sp.]MBT3804874.1 hypothetical protein [Desulfobacula sp.]MBT4026594.1 hypothetical protein [Desulfobacula sp.]MBT4200427.1 hypothetical protein [Desulfobacula sp.]
MSVDQFQKNWTECSGTGGRNARNGWTDSPEYALRPGGKNCQAYLYTAWVKQHDILLG